MVCGCCVRVGASFVPRLSCAGRAGCGPVWVFPDAGWCFPGWVMWLSCVGRAVPHQSRRLALSVVVVLLRPWWLPVPASPGGRFCLWGGGCGGRRWRCSPPPLFCGCCGCWSPAFPVGSICQPRGGRSLVCGSRFFCVAVHWWWLLLVPAVVPLVSAPPPHLFFFAGGPCCVPVPVVGGLPLLRRGSVRACPGCFFFWPVGGCVAVVLRSLWLGVVRLGG